MTKAIEIVRAAMDSWQLQSGKGKIKTAGGLTLLRRIAKRVMTIPEYCPTCGADKGLDGICMFHEQDLVL